MNSKPTSNPPMHPRLYVDPAVFEQERRTLFAPQWMFAGLYNEMAEHNDFMRVPLLGHDVIIHNFRGEPYAFINSCSHRHSVLHDKPSGNRPLTCPYHGWSYDHRGAPIGVPGRQEFPQVMADPMAWRLQDVELERAGSFMFVRLQDKTGTPRETAGPDLRTFLGEAFDFLEAVSSALDVRLDEEHATVAANWKLVIENSLEGYHVPQVHAQSLGAIMQLSIEAGDVEDFYPPTGHNYMHNAANAKWLKRWKGYAAEVGRWPMQFDHYVHRLVFPMLTITSYLGYSFHIQRFHPDAVNATSVHSRIYASRFEGQTERGARIMQAIFRENVHFTHLIFEEDRGAVERTHEGTKQATQPGVLAKGIEQRLADFRTTYLRTMGLEPPAA